MHTRRFRRSDTACFWTGLLLRRGAGILAGVCGLVLLFVAACDGFGLFGEAPGGRVAMTAVYEETLESGRPIHRLVVADVYDPSNYNVLTQAGKYAEQPCFGPEKRRLLFEDHEGALTGSDGVITLLNLESGAIRPLVDSTEGGPRPILGTLGRCVWSPDGSGFYYTAYLAGGFPFQAYYDLEKGMREPPFPRTSDQVFVATRMGGNTLVVSSRKACGEESCQQSTTYLMTPEGQYLSRIDNRYFVDQVGYVVRDWNDERRLFALTYNDTTSTGSKLAVTNRTGSHWVATSGQYLDGLASWGPSGQFLLFDRRGRRQHEYTAHRVMWLDPYSGAVRKFVEPETIDGAVALRQPDY